MTREEAKKHLPEIEALAGGRIVQVRAADGQQWRDDDNPSFAPGFQYRIKPEPREFWIGVYDDGSYGGEGKSEQDVRRSRPSASEYIKVREVL